MLIDDLKTMESMLTEYTRMHREGESVVIPRPSVSLNFVDGILPPSLIGKSIVSLRGYIQKKKIEQAPISTQLLAGSSRLFRSDSHIVSPDDFWHDEAFDLSLLLAVCRLWDSDPLLCLLIHENHLKLSCRQGIADDQVVAVAVERLAALVEEDVWISFELRRVNFSPGSWSRQSRAWQRHTLKEMIIA